MYETLVFNERSKFSFEISTDFAIEIGLNSFSISDRTVHDVVEYRITFFAFDANISGNVVGDVYDIFKKFVLCGRVHYVK